MEISISSSFYVYSLRLSIEYVDLMDSLRWVVLATAAAANAEVDLDSACVRDADTDPLAAGRALLEMVSAKQSDGAKKGSYAAFEAFLKSFTFSDAFMASVPLSLQRKCVAQRLESCPYCRLKGFVLDVWYTGASALAPTALISTAEDFLELIPSSIVPRGSIDPDDAAMAGPSDLIIFELQVWQEQGYSYHVMSYHVISFVHSFVPLLLDLCTKNENRI